MKFILTLTIILTGIMTADAIERPKGDLVFVPNQGQAAASVKFLSEKGRVVAQFADNDMSLRAQNIAVRVEFAGARSLSAVSLAGDTVLYHNTWPGIEIQYAPYQGTVKSEYHVSADADPNLIRLRFDGGQALRILSDGSLMIADAGAAFIESPPYAYQEGEGRVSVPVSYCIHSDGTVGFVLGSYDPSRPLVIDPVMNYSTLFGGSGETTVTSVAFDANGNAVIAGWTAATDLPANGAKKKSGGGVDAFVAKLSASGNQLVWCTYLGGSGDDRAFGVTVDAAGNVYVTGWTQSTTFPVLGAIQTKLAGSRNAFVTKLNSSGTAIVYSTYLGSSHDQGNAIAVDSTGAAYITGDASSSSFPVLNAYQKTFGGGQEDAFVAKLNPAGNALVFSTYVGGNAADHGASIALDASRNVYITGSTYSSNFPTASATQTKIGGGQDAFVAELSATGATLLFGTYIGGSGGTPGLMEGGNGIAVDVFSNVYVAGVTSSIDFPTTTGAYQRSLTNGGANDHGFAWKLNSSKQVVYSTLLAGMNADVVNGVAADPAGNAYLVGSTSSTDFPGVRAFQSALVGTTSGFLLKLNPTGSGLIFGSFLGGSSADAASSVAVDGMQNVIIGGLAQSSDFPLLNAAQSYSNGPYSGFATRVVTGWYPIMFYNGYWIMDTWHDCGRDGSLSTQTTTVFGQTGDVPIVGDWTNSGSTKIGVFRNGLWILDSNGNGVIDASDRQFTFGQTGDIPIVGDWNGTGTVKAGVFRNGLFILDLSGHLSGIATGKQDLSFTFGLPGDKPVAGDWASTGVTNVGVVRGGAWYLDTNGDHTYDNGDQIIYYGPSGTTPLVGDWDGSGTVKVGYGSGGFWSLNAEGIAAYRYGADTQFWFGSAAYNYSFLIGH
jgi:hypothetical protein